MIFCRLVFNAIKVTDFSDFFCQQFNVSSVLILLRYLNNTVLYEALLIITIGNDLYAAIVLCDV